jgi:hypothetical protein
MSSKLFKKLNKVNQFKQHLYNGLNALPWNNADFREVKKTNPDTIRQVFGMSKNRYLKQTINRINNNL